MNYFVIGLPRSRTAWLSVFLSQSGVYCHHEGLNGCHTIQEYKEKIGSNGDSSTGLMMFDIEGMYPDAPILIIEKDSDEFQASIEWCINTYGFDDANHLYKLNEQLSKIKGLRVKQSDIDKRLPEIWAHLIGTKWNKKYAKIKEFNIQSNPYNVDLMAANEILSEAI